MPYFVWRGVDLTATIRKGVQFAPSEKELDLLLLKREIALLSTKVKRSWNIFPVDLSQKIDYLTQLSCLLKAGIRLPEALEVIAQQQTHARLAPIAYDVSHSVHTGLALSKAFARHSHVFEEMIIQLVQAGEESGNLIAVLEVVCAHLESVSTFKVQIRKAVLIPIMTFSFFLLVLFAMFLFIVPQFALLFQSINRSLPTSTYYLLHVSELLRSSKLITLILGIFITLFMVKKSKRYNQWIQKLWLRLPFISTILKNRAQASFLSSTAFLLQGGLPISTALVIAKGAVPDTWLHPKLNRIESVVNAGSSLYDAMTEDPEQIWSAQVIALIKVGQETGALAPMLAKSAQLYQGQINRLLSMIATIIQPLLMLILGLLITLLIVALYEPIFTLSYVVGA